MMIIPKMAKSWGLAGFQYQQVKGHHRGHTDINKVEFIRKHQWAKEIASIGHEWSRKKKFVCHNYTIKYTPEIECCSLIQSAEPSFVIL